MLTHSWSKVILWGNQRLQKDQCDQTLVRCCPKSDSRSVSHPDDGDWRETEGPSLASPLVSFVLSPSWTPGSFLTLWSSLWVLVPLEGVEQILEVLHTPRGHQSFHALQSKHLHYRQMHILVILAIIPMHCSPYKVSFSTLERVKGKFTHHSSNYLSVLTLPEKVPDTRWTLIHCEHLYFKFLPLKLPEPKGWQQSKHSECPSTHLHWELM